MVRSGDWTMEIRVKGTALKEHDIEGHACVQALPDAEFEVCVEYEGFDGLFIVEVLLDGKALTAPYYLDPARETSRSSGSRTLTFSGWEKSVDGHKVRHALAFKGASKVDDGDGDEGRPSAASWSHGVIECRVTGGVKKVLAHDAHSRSHNPDLTSKADGLDEKARVKNGLSLSAGAGGTSFSTMAMWRAGMSYVAEAPGKPRVATLQCFYRESAMRRARTPRTRARRPCLADRRLAVRPSYRPHSVVSYGA
jgi:hypothetical protein